MRTDSTRVSKPGPSKPNDRQLDMKHCHVPDRSDMWNHEAQGIYLIGSIDNPDRNHGDFHTYH
jgi:hypothetical protein